MIETAVAAPTHERGHLLRSSDVGLEDVGAFCAEIVAPRVRLPGAAPGGTHPLPLRGQLRVDEPAVRIGVFPSQPIHGKLGRASGVGPATRFYPPTALRRLAAPSAH